MKLKDTIGSLKLKLKTLYPEEEARNISFMVLEFLGYPRRDIPLRGDGEIDPLLISKLERITKDLMTQRPVQYVLGEADFYGLKFMVNDQVLIPRHETEEMVARIIKDNKIKNPRIIDIGTGSGCIAVCLAREIPGSEVVATDISDEAIKVAIQNAVKNNVKIHFIRDDIFRTILPGDPGFDILVSNPPYVRESEKKWMRSNVLDHEPGLALFVPDDDPLRFYQQIAITGFMVLKRGGFIYAEINEQFGNEVAGIFKDHGYTETKIIKDIHEKDRIVKSMKP